jgi:pyrroline-5-carboxylate reductase
MRRNPDIIVVGYGNMGSALVNGWLARGQAAATIGIVDSQPRARQSAAALGLTVLDSEAARTADAKVVVLAVKPAHLEAAIAALDPQTWSRGVVLSIAAGVTIRRLVELLGDGAAVVRAMPNTPAAIGLGATALSARRNVTEPQRHLCAELLSAVGIVEWLDDESLLDVVTALSGSGPAYVFLLIECLIDAAVELGLPGDVAARLATQTVAGAGAYVRDSEESAAELRRQVTSPGGTTEAALEILQDDDAFAALVRQAVRAATDRSRALGNR